jgi:UTP--glucose-1-phosphate uridylyltransferase
MIKLVITAAGKGTRLLPATKELPKEMMPIFSKIYDNEKVAIPLLQFIFEQMFSIGIRNYCFVVGREKRSIEDHFTPHESYLKEISGNGKKLISNFYKRLNKSHLVWINQNKPLGFGDAVKITEKYIGENDFILHAGDVSIIGKKKHPMLRLIETAKKEPSASAILLCKKVSDAKRYGVPKIGKKKSNHLEIESVEEKPQKPKSNYGILPLYYFKPEIFSSLKKTKRGRGNEFQLTDAIQNLIDNKKKVIAIVLKNGEDEIDVGTVESYKKSLDISFKKA